MAVRCATSILVLSLGSLAITRAAAAPIPKLPDFVPKHETYQGKPIRWWASRAVSNRRTVNHQQRALVHRGAQLRALGRRLRVRWTPTVDYALRLAAAVYAPQGGPSYWKLRSVAWCESRFNPFADNGQYHGIFQMHWAPFGFSPYDPVASALSAAATVVHDGSWRQWECG